MMKVILPVHRYKCRFVNPLAAEFLLYPPLGMELIFYKPSPGNDFFNNIYSLVHIFSWVLLFHGLRNEAPPHPQYRVCVYTLLLSGELGN